VSENRARVGNQLVADGFILGPAGYQSPAHEFQRRRAVFQHDYRGLLARGDVVTRGEERGAANEINQLCQFGQDPGGGLAATHYFWPQLNPWEIWALQAVQWL
jgi:hypothetical protein